MSLGDRDLKKELSTGKLLCQLLNKLAADFAFLADKIKRIFLSLSFHFFLSPHKHSYLESGYSLHHISFSFFFISLLYIYLFPFLLFRYYLSLTLTAIPIVDDPVTLLSSFQKACEDFGVPKEKIFKLSDFEDPGGLLRHDAARVA